MLKAILIDDSQNAIDALQIKLEENCPTVKVIATYTNPLAAINEIPELAPGVIFLDVEMPEMTGFDLLQSLKEIPFEVIFVTAYDHYAVQAIRTNAFDYLEKPVNTKLLKEAVERLLARLEEKKKSGIPLHQQTLLQLFTSLQEISQQKTQLPLTTIEGITMVQVADIMWVESQSNYTKFYISNAKPVTVSKTMGEYEDFLARHNFFRIHRSTIVNMAYIHKYQRGEGGLIELKNGTRLEVSVRKKQEFLDRLSQLGKG
jgi:two-component system, LytTR family, response regulator